mmetsp:Transcript_7992/g.14343  ORF Transcript_7992/g.14343 Transcript_7992/m.14343 type:complete len:241 (-) Transcript_7992:104-826(-)
MQVKPGKRGLDVGTLIAQRCKAAKHLLHGILLLLGLLVGPLLADAGHPRVHPLQPQLAVRRRVLHLAGDGHKLKRGGLLLDGHQLSSQLGRGLQLLGRGIASLRLVGALGEHNQVALVRLQPVHVLLHALEGLVAAAVVNSNTDGGRKLRGDASLLELLQGEATAEADLHVVPLALGVHDRAKGTIHRAREHLLGLGGAGIPAADFARGLVEPGAHVELPLLLEVAVGDNVVVLHLGSAL